MSSPFGWALPRVVALLRRSPVTLGLTVALWGTGIATGSLVGGIPQQLLDRVGLGVQTLASGHWWPLLTSMVFCPGLAAHVLSTMLVLAIGIPAERLIGSYRCATILLVSQLIGGLAALGFVALGSVFAEPWTSYLADEIAVGPSAAVVGLGFALSFRLSALWRRRLRLILGVIVLILALYAGDLQDVLRLTAGSVGFCIGLMLLRNKQHSPIGFPSRSETKVLVAAVVAATALGPIATWFSHSNEGPLGLLQFLFASPGINPDDIRTYCGDPTAIGECRLFRSQTLGTGIGSAITSVAPALLLLATTEGLRRGRRFAWWLALVFNLLLTFGAVLFFAGLIEALNDAGVAISRYLLPLLAPLVVPIVVVGLLLYTRRVFTVSAPRRTYQRLGLLLLSSLVLTSGIYLGVGYLDRSHFDPQPGLLDLLADLPTRFLPPGYQFLSSIGFLPTGGIAIVVWEFCGATFWVIMLISLLVSFWRAKPISPGDAAEKAHVLLRNNSGSSLGYMTTWPGNHYWFTADGNAGFAYRVAATVALTVGGPLGDPLYGREAIDGFTKFCRGNGWTPCLYSITNPMKNTVQELGWQTVQVAEDTIIPLGKIEFTGRKWQDVRTALNNAEKVGIVAEWMRYPEAPLSITDQVRVISEEWIADKGLPEMGFTLGGIEELDDPNVRCLVAVDAQRTVHGITSWLPVYRHGVPIGWTVDFMRRRANGFRGVMEFLIASAVQSLQQEGAEFISLSGAPLARFDRGEQTTALQRILDSASKALEPVYGFQSLLNFKAKFQPQYQPLYLAYPDSSALPAIGNALSRAYLPDLTAWQGLQLVTRLFTRGWR